VWELGHTVSISECYFRPGLLFYRFIMTSPSSSIAQLSGISEQKHSVATYDERKNRAIYYVLGSTNVLVLSTQTRHHLPISICLHTEIDWYSEFMRRLQSVFDIRFLEHHLVF
jgi:hypothetical protein